MTKLLLLCMVLAMAYIFMDESGDLGFDLSKSATSKNFVITFLFAESEYHINRIVSKVFKSMPKKSFQKHCGALHCFKETEKVRLKLFNLLKERDDISIMVIKINKEKIYTRLGKEREVLYSYITNILLNRIHTKKLIPLDKPIHFIASKRDTNALSNYKFHKYLEQNNELPLKISLKRPCDKKGLQIVDFVSWAIFRKEEHKDDSYYNIIKYLIVEENPLF